MMTDSETNDHMIDETRRHLTALVNHSEDAIIAKSLEGTIESWNAAAERMYGWTAEEAIGQPATMLVPPDEEPNYSELLERAARGELVQGREVERVRKDGSRFPISLTLSPIRDDDGRLMGISGIDRDITEVRRYRERLEKLVRERTRELEEREAALRRAEKMEAIGKLTGGVAHDFNNLLHVIDANLRFLRRSLPDSEETRRRFRTVVDAVDRGAQLTSQLLTFARRQPLEPRVVDPGRLLRGMGDLIQRTLPETIEIETTIDDDLWNIVADSHRLENVILNLIINARDAIDGEGRLTIELENARLDEAYAATHSELSPGRYVCLTVSDTGRGMPEEDLERAFEPFFTTKSDEEGTGLGLSTAYGFAKQSGGHIDIESEVGEGTSVRIYLPYTPEAEESTGAVEPAADPTERTDATVLVVEDDDDVRDTAVEMLRDLGYRALEAADGETAMAVLRGGAHVDLVFTDVVMPGPVRSTDLAERARAVLPDVEILFTSAYPSDAIVHQGRLDPAVDLLGKPYNEEQLAHRIREILHGAEHEARSGSPGASDASARGEGRDASPVVLLVEDDRDSRRLTGDILKRWGYPVVAVGDAEAALAAFEEHEIGVLLADITLPGASGAELARKLRKRRPDLAVIFVSGHAPETAYEEGLDDATYLWKPFDYSELENALGRATGNQDT